MKKPASVLLQYCLPVQLLSHCVGKLANCRIGWLKNFLLEIFVKRYRVDMRDAVEQNINNYVTFNDFFTRALRRESRPICSDGDRVVVVSPCDCRVSQMGKINDGTMIQAKGINYSVMQLVRDESLAAYFQCGDYATLYLAPEYYHRVHMPIDGVLQKTIYVPGRLFSVGPKTAECVSGLFTRNERVIIVFDTSVGKMVMVLVGAMIVGNIETVWNKSITSGAAKKRVTVVNYAGQKITMKKGDEVGRFKLGSTVILLFSADKVRWTNDKDASQMLRMGEPLGAIL
jgi:phosphatidylserine decarboxylase